jgi:hypothetical protein
MKYIEYDPGSGEIIHICEVYGETEQDAIGQVSARAGKGDPVMLIDADTPMQMGRNFIDVKNKSKGPAAIKKRSDAEFKAHIEALNEPGQ